MSGVSVLHVMSHCLIFFFVFPCSCVVIFVGPIPFTYSLVSFPPLVVCPLYLSFLHDRPDRMTHVFSFIFHVFFFSLNDDIFTSCVREICVA